MVLLRVENKRIVGFNDNGENTDGSWLLKAYEDCLSATSSRIAPWYIVPADDKENARLIVSRIVVDMFEGLDMAYPKVNAKRRRELQMLRRQLALRA